MAENFSKISLEISKLTKEFDRRPVFKDLNFSLTNSDSIAITGKNGSGKSTLIKVLANVYAQTAGNITFSIDGKAVERQNVYQYIGFVSPYLNLYDQLTGEENLVFFATLSGINLPGKTIDELLATVGLEGRGVDPVGAYSSGMKQRLKYAVALLKDPAFIFLDEPSSNLDSDGKAFVRQFVGQRRSKSIVLIATNEEEDYSLTDELIRLGQ